MGIMPRLAFNILNLAAVRRKGYWKQPLVVQLKLKIRLVVISRAPRCRSGLCNSCKKKPRATSYIIPRTSTKKLQTKHTFHRALECGRSMLVGIRNAHGILGDHIQRQVHEVQRVEQRLLLVLVELPRRPVREIQYIIIKFLKNSQSGNFLMKIL